MDKEAMLLTHLALANDHLSLATERIAEQKARIEHLADERVDTNRETEWLAILEETLQVMLSHRDYLLQEIQDYAARPGKPSQVASGWPV